MIPQLRRQAPAHGAADRAVSAIAEQFRRSRASAGAGALGHAAGLLAAADVNVEYACSSVRESQTLATAVVGVDDAERAVTATGI